MPYDGSEQLLECRIWKSDEVICSEFWLSFWREVHYNPLYEIRDALIPQKLKKKRWLFKKKVVAHDVATYRKWEPNLYCAYTLHI
ncbi:hypothetical protein BT93_H2303 [Corymbia citriodora subsp. variegata]|nr:hypothetical protein BT93_H2303 [Corymbia citriodora subsp. variegata]